MILSSLYAYYQRLLECPDESSGGSKVPPYGFTDENISFCLVLSKTGAVVDIQDIRNTNGKKLQPKRLSVPRSEKRTSGIKPNFLWDKSAYALGVEGNKDKSTAKDKPWVLSGKTYDAFARYHLQMLQGQTDAGLQAVCQFLKTWKPQHFAQALFQPEQVDANFVFRLDGVTPFIHDSPAAKGLWLSLLQPDGATSGSTGMCLVTGEQAPPSRLHPAIKGVYGGQRAGGSIVSFNAKAYESFGKEQGDNAPVSGKAAFAYTTALNYLLRRENSQCISIGDTSTVFWAQAKDAAQEQAAVGLFDAIFNPSPPRDDGQTKQVRLTIEKIAQGHPLKEAAPDVHESTRFFVLGLAPNASRLSIRFWLGTNMGKLGENIVQHWQDIQLQPLPWKAEQPPSIWCWLIETAAHRKSENIPPQLAGEFLRSIITGQRYPRMLLAQLVQRMRADGKINGMRVALIKAVLYRDHRKGFLTEEVSMALDLENTPLAYRLGCLFATLEHIQRNALGTVNASIVDRYYGTASSVPYLVFPRLIASVQNHLSKIRKDKPGFAFNLNKDLATIIAGVSVDFPKQLKIEQQGQFAIGYYHQKNSYFIKKDTSPQDESESETSTH